ncbi:hypothetical protein V7157_17330 [Neobacillus drentensis]
MIGRKEHDFLVGFKVMVVSYCAMIAEFTKHTQFDRGYSELQPN